MSWASPLANKLYYHPTSTGGSGKVQLILNLTVVNDQLRAIYNEFVAPSLAGVLTRAEFTDSLLFQLLQGSHGRLRDIVATIQEQQYRIIQTPIGQLLVVQGSPGSGKTSIALHRVAYLLYNHRDSLAAEKILILVPNRMFLRHISEILPSLGERRVPQRTVDDWTIGLLGDKINYEPLETSLETFLDPTVDRAWQAMLFRNARNKGSLVMAKLIDRHLARLYEQIIEGMDKLTCTYPEPSRSLSNIQVSAARSREAVQALLEKAKQLPLNERRNVVERLLQIELTNELLTKYVSQFSGRLSGDEQNSLRKKISDEVEKQLRQYFTGWQTLNAGVVYRQILRAPQVAGVGLFSPWDLELLAADVPTNTTPFRFSDLAAIMYVKLQLEGSGAVSYDHIVIDEAQDMTPLHFFVLRHFCRSNSMTIVGDTGQGIYLHQGIEDWQAIANALEGTLVPEHVRESYRSTHQIIEFANKLRERTGVASSENAIPVARPGPEPSRARFAQRSALIEDIAATVRREQQNSRPSIAIVCKTVAACRAMAHDLVGQRLADVQLLVDRNQTYQGRTVVIPSYLTKGMEFDIVIVPDADAVTYPPDQLHARLLYVVITRAAHALHIRWDTSITPMLDPQQPSVPLLPMLGGALTPRMLTLAEYVQERPALNTDWCVERLARLDKLALLEQGKADPIVLDMLLRTERRPVAEDDETESRIFKLEPAAQQVLRNQIVVLETAPDPAVQDALALTQLTYGLLRHQLRSAGLEILDEGGVSLDEQIVLLASIFDGLQAGRFSLRAGRWTTRQVVLQAVETGRRAAVERVIEALSQRGIIESSPTTKRPEIRLALPWVQPLLALALGRPSDAWDSDLIETLVHLSQPLDWTIKATPLKETVS